MKALRTVTGNAKWLLANGPQLSDVWFVSNPKIFYNIQVNYNHQGLPLFVSILKTIPNEGNNQ
jgi:hypothetical protein